MDKKELNSFIKYLLKTYQIFGPLAPDGLELGYIRNVSDLILNGKIARHSFKKLFLPSCETLFRYKNDDLIEEKVTIKPEVAFGMTYFDLKALNLFDHIFEKDPYYQERRKNIIVVGQSYISNNLENSKAFKEKFEEDILEHLRFDLFFRKEKDHFEILTGSEKGQEILNKFGFKDYDHVQFAGPIREEGQDPRMVKIRDKMKEKYNKKVWEELGKRCIECGKCTIACPTCYCFRLDDEPNSEKDTGERVRCWDSCFYHEFSEVAGSHKFLNSTEKRIYFWYVHKFIRIPDKYSFSGCVGCGRCSGVCPVGIKINEVLKEILE